MHECSLCRSTCPLGMGQLAGSSATSIPIGENARETPAVKALARSQAAGREVMARAAIPDFGGDGVAGRVGYRSPQARPNGHGWAINL
ncbi:hypothetical protein EMIT0P43_130036 [Pseudomonas jessenii]